ncbi:hypothetical protein Nmel_013968 [Mimus melanotis]
MPGVIQLRQVTALSTSLQPGHFTPAESISSSFFNWIAAHSDVSKYCQLFCMWK